VRDLGNNTALSVHPSVSVIVPNYNHAPYLRQRIESILGQTYKDIEVILLDDCSTDASRAIISEYSNDPRVRIEFNKVNSGSTFKQWKKGMGLAHGEYVWVAESDDYADERLLEKLVKVLDEEPEVTFVYCRSFRVTPDGQPGLDGQGPEDSRHRRPEGRPDTLQQPGDAVTDITGIEIEEPPRYSGETEEDAQGGEEGRSQCRIAAGPLDVEHNGDQRDNDDCGLREPVQIRPDVIHSPPHSIASGNASRWIEQPLLGSDAKIVALCG